MQFNLADLFEAVAGAVPDREALVCGPQRLSYAALDGRASQLARYLRRQGVGPGDHVGLYLYNGVEYIEALLACFKIRAVPVNINYRYISRELQYLFDSADLKICIFHRCFADNIQQLFQCGHTFSLLLWVEDGSGAEVTLPAADYRAALSAELDADPFGPRRGADEYLLYTGGTTGSPKGVVWQHEKLFFAAMGGGGYFSAEGACRTPDDIVKRLNEHPFAGIAMAPLMHGAAQWFSLVQLLAGNKLVLLPQPAFDAQQAWQCVADEGCNLVQIVGDAMAVPLIEALDSWPGRWNLTAVFSIGSGGALLSPSSRADLLRHFPKAYLTNSYGSSESGQMGMDVGAYQGVGVARIEARDDAAVLLIRGDALREARVGEQGILARSGMIPEGYYGDPDATAATFVNLNGRRWLLTGDIAQRDESGVITIFGRGNNCINSGGEKVFPEEVEMALKSHPAVLDALVFGVEDARWGSRVTAVVQTRDNQPVDQQGLLDHCRSLIAAYKLPRQIQQVVEVPRSVSGKPDYPRARQCVRAAQPWQELAQSG